MLPSLLYRIRLNAVVERASPKPASLTGASSCQRSGVCCWRRPCDLFSGDVERLAAHLSLTPPEVFRQYLVVDMLTDSSGRSTLRLLPRREHQVGGVFVTAAESWSIETPCVFLVDGKACRVHDAKPTGGAAWSCSMSAAEVAAMPSPVWTREALTALGWDGEIS